MALTARDAFARSAQFARTPRARKIGWWIAGVLAFIAVAGFLVAPPLVKHELEKELSAQLHRKTTVERVHVNPFALSFNVYGLVIRERGGENEVVGFDELYASVSSASLFRLAPVVKEMRLVKPRIHVVRNDDRSYNFQDLIDEFLAKPDGPTPHFSLNNIEVIDGRIEFDDRPEKQKHEVTDIKIGLPFLSSLPYATALNVQPALSARFDGALFSVTGQTRPFEDTHYTELNLDIDALQLPRLLEYSPVPLQFKLASGQLDTRLKLLFATRTQKPGALKVTGTAALSKVDLRALDDAPLLVLPSFTVDMESLDVLGKSANVKSVRIDGIEANVKRLKNSALNLMALIKTGPNTAAPAKTTAKKASGEKTPAQRATEPFKFAVTDLQVTNGTVRIEDQVPARPARIVLNNFELAMQALSNAPDSKATGKLSFKADALNTFAWDGNMQLAPLRVGGKLDLTGLRVNALRPYYENSLDLEIAQGTLDLGTSFAASLDGEKFEMQVSELGAALKSLQANLPGEKEPVIRIPTLEITGAAADLGKHNLTIGEIKGRAAATRIVRDADGRLNLARIVKPAGKAAASEPPAESAPWNISVKRAALDAFAVDYADLTRKTPIRTQVSQLAINAENFSNAKAAKSNVNIRAIVNKAGKLALAGQVGANPVSLKLKVDATAVDVLPLQPLVEDKLNIAITSGGFSAKGALTLDAPPGAPVKAAYKGDAGITDFAAVDRLTVEDLLKWKSLYFSSVDVALDPLQASIDGIALTDFYSRLIVNPDGTFNLQHLVKKPGEPEAQGTSPPDPTAKTGESKAAAATSNAPAPAPTQTGQPANVSIGKITLQNGTIDFTDHFIKPNYSADLSQMTGSIGKMTQDTAGDVELRGMVQKTAPLEILGRINPLAKDLFLDIKASAKDIELSPMTPYAVKYAGYGIEKGKLSMDVKYKVENRKLAAENHIVLNQLTFGDKVDSPTATKLPVLFAVNLLKDRNGVIDINLPVSGSLDDPQFSVGGIVIRLIVNLFIKAVTSPFALIGSLFGGSGGEELAYLEFAPGRAAISSDATKKLGTIAKALNDRPALHIEVGGRTDADSDKEGLRQASLDRKVKAQKIKAALKTGEGTAALDEVKVEPAEYEKYLKAAYSDEKFPKPRNMIGLAKTLPVPEMEQLMLTNAQVTDEDLRELANQRAQAVKNWLVQNGKVPAERVFLVAPKISAEGIKDKGKPNRVDFSLK